MITRKLYPTINSETTRDEFMDYLNELPLDDYAKVLSKLGQKKSEI